MTAFWRGVADHILGRRLCPCDQQRGGALSAPVPRGVVQRGIIFVVRRLDVGTGCDGDIHATVVVGLVCGVEGGAPSIVLVVCAGRRGHYGGHALAPGTAYGGRAGRRGRGGGGGGFAALLRPDTLIACD